MLRYTSIFATEEHQKITSIEAMKKFKEKQKYNQYFTMGLFLDKTCLGHGSLCLYDDFPDAVETSTTKIFDEFRNQGHGINLYLHLIKTAKRIGAKRIYSDCTLNALSEKMWLEKLPKHFRVFRTLTGKKEICNCCRKKHRHNRRYYIDLWR